MAGRQQEQEELIRVLGDNDNYKDNTKVYKAGVKHVNMSDIKLVIGTAQHILVTKTRYAPSLQLNTVRLIKECFDLFVQEFMDQVAEQILPLMSQIAHFQSSNPRIDRGKEYFLSDETSHIPNIQMLGNSFLRLVLECIYAWAKQLPLSQFADTYNTLVEQNITFPTQFNYFKPESLMGMDEIILRRSNIHASKLRDPQSSNIQQSKVQSSDERVAAQIAQKQSQVVTAGGEIEKTEENPFVAVNNAVKHIQQVKGTLLEGLSKADRMDDQLLEYFRQEFSKFQQNAQGYSQQLTEQGDAQGGEDLLGTLFNENEFAELFTQHSNSFLSHQINWQEFQKKFTPYFKKPLATNNTSNQPKFGETSQTIGEQYVSIRMQPEMLASDPTKNNLQPKQFNQNNIIKAGSQDNNDNEDGEKTIQRNSEFTDDNKTREKKQKNHEEEEEQKEMMELQPHNNPRREEYQKSESGRQTLREALNKNEYEKYKCELKSKTNFSKVQSPSSNYSNMSNQSVTQRKALLSKLPGQRESNNGNTQDSAEILQQRLADAVNQIESATAERDHYKKKYEEAQQEIDDLLMKIAREANSRDKGQTNENRNKN